MPLVDTVARVIWAVAGLLLLWAGHLGLRGHGFWLGKGTNRANWVFVGGKAARVAGGLFILMGIVCLIRAWFPAAEKLAFSLFVFGVPATVAVFLVWRLTRGGNPVGNGEARTSCQSGAPRPMLEINVVADASGKPIPGASVVLAAPPRILMVDSGGHVLVDTLPAGTYALWIRALGFQAQSVAGVRLDADSHCKVAVRMAREWDEGA